MTCLQAIAEAVRWNGKHPVEGLPVVRIDDIGNAHITKTRSQAWAVGSRALVMVEGCVGGYLLERIHPIIEEVGSSGAREDR